jgi:Lrp/AsnC family transcriptional regulator for asnA, asnC and gidA
VGAVRMRYKRLWKAGIITGEIMQVNPCGLGYKYFGNIGIITDRENESKVNELLKSKSYIPLIIAPFGRYTFGSLFALHSIQELSYIQEDLEANPMVKRVDTLIWAQNGPLDRMENLIIRPFTNKNEPKHAAVNPEETQIDEIDRKIAKILSQKSRTPFLKIAEQLNISSKNVIQRYKRLRGNVLTSSTITVDLNKLGYNAGAIFFMNVTNRSKIPEIQNQLLQIPNLIATMKYIGPVDLFAYVVLADFADLFKLKQAFRGIKDIEKAEPVLEPLFPSWPPNHFGLLL